MSVAAAKRGRERGDEGKEGETRGGRKGYRGEVGFECICVYIGAGREGGL